eukprot:CAMPEP_0181090960 /NCGR_PEP_ID=MMETSP1071-20121207/8142_1 /TAXON_ID=35127 /ORGANISM="Thalassiosira sp., Strain NH16" /LENGTH=113 /DNA_ID=CAMNT_0023173065 /DNA_START=227 /DNA_END=569 /DNA_ORIENTATION=-
MQTSRNISVTKAEMNDDGSRKQMQQTTTTEIYKRNKENTSNVGKFNVDRSNGQENARELKLKGLKIDMDRHQWARWGTINATTALKQSTHPLISDEYTPHWTASSMKGGGYKY